MNVLFPPATASETEQVPPAWVERAEADEVAAETPRADVSPLLPPHTSTVRGHYRLASQGPQGHAAVWHKGPV